MPKKELVSILKRSSPESTQKDLADLLDEALEQSPASFLKKAKLPMATSTPEVVTKRIDTQSVAEYLILDDGEARRKEVTFAKDGEQTPKRIKMAGAVKEDCDSFYGSDKETDEPVIFSDDTEIEVGSSSSEESDFNGRKVVGRCLRSWKTVHEFSSFLLTLNFVFLRCEVSECVLVAEIFFFFICEHDNLTRHRSENGLLLWLRNSNRFFLLRNVFKIFNREHEKIK